MNKIVKSQTQQMFTKYTEGVGGIYCEKRTISKKSSCRVNIRGEY